MPFLNRESELAALEGWWNQARHGALGLVWGRRRVGKTRLAQQFATGRRAVFHTAAGRPLEGELASLSRAAAPLLAGDLRDLARRPFADWEGAFETLPGAPGSAA